jgi:hypothetical protein
MLPIFFGYKKPLILNSNNFYSPFTSNLLMVKDISL